MANTRVIIDIIVNARDSASDMSRAARQWDTFGGAMEGLAAPAGIALGAIGGLAAGAAKAASDLQQSSGGVDAVFKSSAGAVHEWAKTSAQDVGLASSEYQRLAAGLGGALSGMGVPLDQAAQSTHDLTQRAADLASVFGGTTAQAAEAMTSAFRGEYDSLQRLIPSISDTAVKHQMGEEAAQGLTYATEEQAKAAAITNLIMQESASAAGNFAKESDTAAGAQAIASAKFKDTAAALGTQLLPAVTTVMGWLTTLGNWVSDHIPLVTTLAVVIGTLAAAVLAVNAAMAVAAAAQAIATAATAAWSAAAGLGAIATTAFGVAMAILTSPITLIIGAILALIAIVVLLVKNWDTVSAAAKTCWDFIVGVVGDALEWIKGLLAPALDWITGKWSELSEWIAGVWEDVKAVAAKAFDFIKYAALGPIGLILAALKAFGVDTTAIFEKIKEIGSAIWGFIQKAAETALGLIMKPINAVKEGIEWVIKKIKEALNWAKDLVGKIPFIGGIFSSSAPASSVAAPAAAPSLVGVAPRLSVGSRKATSSAGGSTIIVNGALDPVAVARQITNLLAAQNRRSKGVAI